jgi:hypothetical protein
MVILVNIYIRTKPACYLLQTFLLQLGSATVNPNQPENG